ncbi:(deoxy)nucleoside triphosphate pyrophosphohydrolase [Mangrovimonas sp. ST2L15]|uniref:(deoxy)nucleoside triphosphate pyrophosphohydrolase n=1 Tax=Mangrovimonas sp. ST2L15 TaxID=1645916 RepID=UPI0006B45390|nr:NUDIX domain-containing protein [Mangrovimonas sp. ST2L15]
MNVVCGVIFKDNHVFIARRKQGKSLEEKWEFPGGKIENKESEKEALSPELFEELGMQVEIKKRIGSFPYQFEEVTINLIGYSCDFVSASFKMTDHDSYEWLPPEELKKMICQWLILL